jgi:hypothetical protein
MKFSKNINLSSALFFVCLGGGSVAQGYIVAGDNGGNGANLSETTLVERYADFAYWDNVVTIGGGTGVYLGALGNTGYVLTANHLGLIPDGGGSIAVAGQSYTVASSRRIGTSDARLYEISIDAYGFQAPALSSIAILDRPLTVGETILSIGRGARVQGSDGLGSTSDMIVIANGMSVYQWAGAGALSWGENKVANVPVWLGVGATATWTSSVGANESAFFTVFDDPGAGNYANSWESIAAAGDSGGPAFVYENGEWVLAGITSTVLYRNNQPANTAAFGMRASYVNLEAYGSELPDFSNDGGVVPEPSTQILLFGALGTLILRRRRG